MRGSSIYNGSIDGDIDCDGYEHGKVALNLILTLLTDQFGSSSPFHIMLLLLF